MSRAKSNHVAVAQKLTGNPETKTRKSSTGVQFPRTRARMTVSDDDEGDPEKPAAVRPPPPHAHAADIFGRLKRQLQQSLPGTKITTPLAGLNQLG